MKYLQVKLKDEKHDKFKEKCTKNSTDMSKQVNKWIDEYLKGG